MSSVLAVLTFKECIFVDIGASARSSALLSPFLSCDAGPAAIWRARCFRGGGEREGEEAEGEPAAASSSSSEDGARRLLAAGASLIFLCIYY